VPHPDVARLREPRWYEYTGITPEEAYRADWFRKLKPETTRSGRAFHHPEDASGAKAKWLGEILGRKTAGEIEMRLRRRDGEYRWFLIRIEPHLDDQGNWCGGTGRTLTSKISGEPRRSSAGRTGASSDYRRDPPHHHGPRPEGVVLYANKAVLDYTGLSMEEVGAEDFRARVFHPEDVTRSRTDARGLARGQHSKTSSGRGATTACTVVPHPLSPGE